MPCGTGARFWDCRCCLSTSASWCSWCGGCANLKASGGREPPDSCEAKNQGAHAPRSPGLHCVPCGEGFAPMNLKTTLVLALVLAVGGIGWLVYALARPMETVTKPVAVLPDELTAAQLQRIEMSGERPVVLERSAGGDWTLPGHWPTRKAEVEQLV